MKKTILIVDDNSADFYMLKILLEANGLEIMEAENGKDALDKAHAHPPDLILSDILMPVMDGYALCRQCKSDERLKHIPFVFYTATYTEPRDEKFALRLGADRFIHKPQEPEILVDALQEVIDEKYIVKHPSIKPLGEELEFLRGYNEILFSKLEKKMLDLEIANHQLKTLEERYRLSFENVADVIYTIDNNLNLLDVSPSVERILGYKPQDFVGRPVSDLGNIFTPESFEQAISGASRVLKGETIAATIYELVAKDGTVKMVEVSGSPVMRDGQIAGLISVARDITKRRRAEEALRKTEARFRSYFELPLIGIAITSPEKGWIEVNDRLSDIVGYSFHELKDMTWSELTHPEDLDADVERFNRILAGEIDSYMVDKRFIRNDGEVIWTSLAVGCVRKQDGTVDYFVAMMEDITARKESEERIRKTLGVTVHAIAVIVETKDPYTAGHQMRVADLARSIASEMSLTPDQIEGIHVAGIIHDLGKISVPAEILSKSTKLTEIEFELIKMHPQSGHDILKDIEFPWPISRMVLEHHERMDGSGYPNELTGEKLLLESRILSVADVVEAMASHRPYRPSLEMPAALEEISKNKGVLYDPKVSDACLRLFQEKGYQFK